MLFGTMSQVHHHLAFLRWGKDLRRSLTDKTCLVGAVAPSVALAAAPPSVAPSVTLAAVCCTEFHWDERHGGLLHDFNGHLEMRAQIID